MLAGRLDRAGQLSASALLQDRKTPGCRARVSCVCVVVVTVQVAGWGSPLVPVVFEYRHCVRSDEADRQGHANNVVFVRWMQDAAVAHSEAQGWSHQACREAGVAWVARSHFIEYRRPAFPGDDIVITTWIADMRRIASTRKYRMERTEGSDRVLVARAETVWVLVDAATGKPRRIPPQILEAFELAADPPA